MDFDMGYADLCHGAKENRVVTLVNGIFPVTNSSIQAGIDAADSGSVVVVCPGRYLEAPEIVNFGALDLTIVAPYGPEATVVDGWGFSRSVFTLTLACVSPIDGPKPALTVSVTGLGITGGTPTDDPYDAEAGVLVESPGSGCPYPVDVAFDGVDVYGNAGPGITAWLDGQVGTSSIRIVDSRVFANTEGGIGVSSDTPILLAGTHVFSNLGGYGGVSVHGELIGGVIEGNVADYGGGLSMTYDSRATDTVIVGNTAMYGGGIYIQSGNASATLTNVWIEDNRAEDGGGIYADSFWGIGGTLTLEGTTVVTGNVASGDGGGIHTEMSIVGNGILPIVDNAAARGGGIFLNCGDGVEGVLVGRNVADEGGGVFVQTDRDAQLKDSTVFDGFGGTGGGIRFAGIGDCRDWDWLDYPALHLDDVAVTGNSAITGGGVAVSDGALDIDGGWVSANHASVGGGLWIGPGGTADLTGGAIAANEAKLGGGAAFEGEWLTSVEVDWATGTSDNAPEDLSLGGWPWDGDGWDSFRCTSAGCDWWLPPILQ